jgi:hypothetical protein
VIVLKLLGLFLEKETSWKWRNTCPSHV